MAIFRNIPVLPTGMAYRTTYDGGPVWPDWDNQGKARHCRAGKPMPIRPPDVPAKLEYVDEAFIWGGQVHRNFGHQIAEYSTRVLQSLRDRPDDRLLFSLWPGASVKNIPAHFHAVMDWYGVPGERIKFVTAPFRAREVRVAAQPEQLGGPGPEQWFLDLQSENTRRRGLAPATASTVYVSRAGLLTKLKSSWLGESYLAELLDKTGVRVISPEQETLPTQLAHYAGAKTLVFAEGSAAHGRQLLGYHDQRIAVLVRRPGARIARQNLASRCRDLDYFEVTKCQIGMVQRDGTPENNEGLSVYDVPVLLDVWKRLGVDLGGQWDADAFQERCENDLVAWVKRSFDPNRQRSGAFDWGASLDRVRRDMEQAGFASLMPRVKPFLVRKVAPVPFGQRLRKVSGRAKRGVIRTFRART